MNGQNNGLSTNIARVRLLLNCSCVLFRIVEGVRNGADAETVLAEWKKFGEKEIVKYNDFVVKKEENGKIKRSNTGLVDKIVRPGYPKEFWKKIAEETGDRYLVPAVK